MDKTAREVPESPFSGQNVCFGADVAEGFVGMELAWHPVRMGCVHERRMPLGQANNPVDELSVPGPQVGITEISFFLPIIEVLFSATYI